MEDRAIYTTMLRSDVGHAIVNDVYRKFSYLRRTKSQNLDVSRLVLPLFLPNPLKLGVKSRMKMQVEQRR